VKVMSLLRALAVLWLIRKGLRLARSLVVAALLAAVWPVTVTGAAAVAGAWLRGWPPARLYRAAARSLPMTVVYLTGTALRYHRWQGLALGVAGDWQQATSLLSRARIAQPR
jgi:hypothetical protein